MNSVNWDKAGSVFLAIDFNAKRVSRILAKVVGGKTVGLLVAMRDRYKDRSGRWRVASTRPDLSRIGVVVTQVCQYEKLKAGESMIR